MTDNDRQINLHTRFRLRVITTDGHSRETYYGTRTHALKNWGQILPLLDRYPTAVRTMVLSHIEADGTAHRMLCYHRNPKRGVYCLHSV